MMNMDGNDEVRATVGKEIGEGIAKGIAQGIAKGIALLIGFLIFIALGGVVVQWLWNWLVPSIFGLREVTLWEALGLLALSRILFGGFAHGRGSSSGPRRQRREWWKKEGPQARNEPQSWTQ
jgi:hypothetical protein